MTAAAHDSRHWIRPSQLCDADRAANMAAARAVMDAERFSLLSAPDRPDMGYAELTPDDDIAIRPQSLVRVLASPSECPLFVKVLRVYSDDTLKVCLPYAPAVACRTGVEDVALVLVPECVELEATG